MAAPRRHVAVGFIDQSLLAPIFNDALTLHAFVDNFLQALGAHPAVDPCLAVVLDMLLLLGHPQLLLFDRIIKPAQKYVPVPPADTAERRIIGIARLRCITPTVILQLRQLRFGLTQQPGGLQQFLMPLRLLRLSVTEHRAQTV